MSSWLCGTGAFVDCSGPVPGAAATVDTTCCGGPGTEPTCDAQNPKAAAKSDSAASTARAD